MKVAFITGAARGKGTAVVNTAERWGRIDGFINLASQEASNTTGSESTVDGGQRHTWMTHKIKNRIRPGEFE